MNDNKKAANDQTEEQVIDTTPEEEAAPDKITEADKAQTEGGMTLEDQILDLEDRNLRLLAEMQNLRTRQAKDLKDTREYAVTGFAQDMITLSENIHRAREAIPDAEDELYKNILKGIDMTIEELKRVFAKHGIERIDPKPGEKFDYKFHQAIAQVPTNEVEDGCVLNTIAAGYKIKDRLLNPAMVAVAKKQDLPN